MPVWRSLRLKFVSVFALAGIVLVLSHAIAIQQLNRYQEEQLIDQIVSDEMEDLLQQYQRHGMPENEPFNRLQRYDVRPDTEALSLRKWFRASWLVQSYIVRKPEERLHLPPELRDLPPGFHDVVSKGDLYRVEVREIGEVRFYIAYSVILHQKRGHKFTQALIISAALTALITIFMGLWLSGRLTYQIDDLARRVRAFDGQPSNEMLASHYRENEVVALAAAFDGYHDRTVRLLERERAFTADVSHELRTPLTAIQTGCELMLDDPALPAKVRLRAEKIAAASGRLTDLVNAFLLLAREQAEAIGSEIDLRDCVEEAVDSLREKAEAKGLSLLVDTHDSVAVRAPHKALQIVLINLLANAISYTERGTVSLRTEGATVKIEDTGCGVTVEKVPELFRRFRRGDARSGDGFGLGLAIVKRICEQLGWRIGIEPRPGGGTRVLLSLV